MLPILTWKNHYQRFRTYTYISFSFVFSKSENVSGISFLEIVKSFWRLKIVHRATDGYFIGFSFRSIKDAGFILRFLQAINAYFCYWIQLFQEISKCCWINRQKSVISKHRTAEGEAAFFQLTLLKLNVSKIWLFSKFKRKPLLRFSISPWAVQIFSHFKRWYAHAVSYQKIRTVSVNSIINADSL